MAIAIDGSALDQIFHDARSFNGWLNKPVSSELIEKIYDTWKYGPTSANCSPARIVFLQSDAAKERLKPFLIESNVEKVMSAPVVAVIGYDLEFFERIPELFPHNPDAKFWFAGNDPLIEETAFRNGTLQGAYLMLATRAHGLDCGPMSGFDRDGATKEFFAGTKVVANFICSIGYGDHDSIFDRSPRLAFEDACQVL